MTGSIHYSSLVHVIFSNNNITSNKLCINEVHTETNVIGHSSFRFSQWNCSISAFDYVMMNLRSFSSASGRCNR